MRARDGRATVTGVLPRKSGTRPSRVPLTGTRSSQEVARCAERRRRVRPRSSANPRRPIAARASLPCTRQPTAAWPASACPAGASRRSRWTPSPASRPTSATGSSSSRRARACRSAASPPATPRRPPRRCAAPGCCRRPPTTACATSSPGRWPGAGRRRWPRPTRSSPSSTAGLCADPLLAELPGRFLFGVDDGAALIAIEQCDVALVAEGGGAFRLWLAGRATTLAGDARGQAAALALASARVFRELRGDAWRIADLRDGAARIADCLGGALHGVRARARRPPARPRRAHPARRARRGDRAAAARAAGLGDRRAAGRRSASCGCRPRGR